MRDDRGRASMAVAIATTVGGVLPVFLTGALAVQMRPALHESTAVLGLVVGAFFAAAAVASAPMGRLADRIGPRLLLVAASLLSAGAQLAIAMWVIDTIELSAALVAAGTANAATQVAANLLLARNVEPQRQGLAFGVKQAAIPLATLIGGVAVPTVALTVGWQWAYAGGSALAVLAAGAAARLSARAQTEGAEVARSARESGGPERGPRRRLPLAALAVLALGAGLGSASANALGAFLVSSVVASGLSPGGAGLIAAFGSAFGLLARLVAGVLADRRGKSHLVAVAVMLALGSVAEGLLSRQLPLLLLLPTVAVAYAAGWGWNGLLNLAVVRQVPFAPAAATGVTQTGVNAGGALGPIAFGFALGGASYPFAWVLVSVGSLGAALLVVVSQRLLRAVAPVEQR